MLSRRCFGLLMALLALTLAGCGQIIEPIRALVPEAAVSQDPIATAMPTAQPTATPATEMLTEPGVIVLTDEEYRNGDLGIVWHRPNDDWAFYDASDLDGLLGELTPLVVLTPKDEGEELYVTLASVELSEMQLHVMARSFQLYPEVALQGFMDEYNGGDHVELTEIAGAQTIFTTVSNVFGGTKFLWTIIHPQAILFVIAEGFDDAAAVDPLLAGLQLIESSTGAEDRPDIASLSPEEAQAYIVQNVERLRELDTREPVPFEFMNRAELRADIKKRMAEEEGNSDVIAAEDRMLELLQLIPVDSDLSSTVLDLYESELLGFYDDEEDAFYLINDEKTDGAPLNWEDEIVFAHEYAHALQDQHFDLSRFSGTEGDQYNTDEHFAIRALIEGEAETVTFFYILDTLDPDQFKEFAGSGGNPGLQAPERTPSFIRGSIDFPYVEGHSFVESIFMDGGWEAVNELWKNLPASSEQILHPEKYPGDVPTVVTLPDDLADRLGGGWREELRDVWGELQLRLMLAEALNAFGMAGAAGWDGDEYVFLTNGELSLFLTEIVWDNSSDAEEGDVALRSWLFNKGLVPQDDNHFAGKHRNAFLRTAGDRVFFGIADDPAALEAAVTVLGWKAEP
jgi:hypothetical protein